MIFHFSSYAEPNKELVVKYVKLLADKTAIDLGNESIEATEDLIAFAEALKHNKTLLKLAGGDGWLDTKAAQAF